MKLLFIDTVHPILQNTLLKYGYDCVMADKWSKEEILEKIELFQGIVIRSRIPIDQAFLDATKNLKFIARAGAGLENIDVSYAKSKKIMLINAPEGNRDAVAEHTLGMLLSLFNKLNQADKEVRKGKWLREENRGIELKGKTVGIIGYGYMGAAFAQRLMGFECTVLAYDKYKKGFGTDFIKEVDQKIVLEKSDVLSLHIPLTEETHHFVNEGFIQSVKKNFYLINTARGNVVDTNALAEGIKSGKILGACLDVLEHESSSFEELNPSPSLQYLLDSDKTILSPHIAGWTVESHEKLSSVLAEKIVSLF